MPDFNQPMTFRQILATYPTIEVPLIEHPEVISYCHQQEIRCGFNVKEIYLLEKRQMNGYHAELFSYVLYLELSGAETSQKFAPLKLQPYQPVRLSDSEPHLLFVCDGSTHRARVLVWSDQGQFRVRIDCAKLAQLPEVETALCADCSFAKEDETLLRLVPRADIHQVLTQVAQTLCSIA